MRIIIAPAKKMKTDDSLSPISQPVFIQQSAQLKDYIDSLSFEELKQLFGCNDAIVKQSRQQFSQMDLRNGSSAAILSYNGIQYQYMAADVFDDGQFAYVQQHLRILSGFYGVLKPLDGICPYRLEMASRIQLPPYKDLYDFWGDCLYHEVKDNDGIIINLASQEYSRCIGNYLNNTDHMISCVFARLHNGKALTKSVYAKMARGQMVRYMAENRIDDVQQIKGFNVDGYRFNPSLSDDTAYVFIKENEQETTE